MGSAQRFLRLFHTLRHLRPVQFYGRLWFRLHRPRPDVRPAPGLRKPGAPWILPARRPRSLVGPQSFRFLNETHEIASPDDWNNPLWPKLWLYNLHYLDDLNAQESESRSAWHHAVVDRWMRDNRPATGNGWEPYCLSLRIVNLIKWALGGHPLEPAWVHSIAVQARFLSRRMEYHLLGNHLFENAKALVFAGLFFEGPEAVRFLEMGLRVLRRELDEQVLADSGHFERSPMYHCIILEDLLDLVNLSQTYSGAIDANAVRSWRSAARSMQDWLACMCHPDGQIPLFNDSAFAISPPPAALHDYAARLGLGTLNTTQLGARLLERSGYAKLATGPAALLADVGSVGPSYLPAHAHASTLSFELSIFGRRVIVDTGTSSYGAGEERQRQRSTSAHNTLMIDECDSSEVWGSFRVARRARVSGVAAGEHGGALFLEGAHDGYHHLPGRLTHWRRWHLDDCQLVIADEVRGAGNHEVEFYFHLHPEWEARLSGRQCDVVHTSAGMFMRFEFDDSLNTELTQSTYHPEFGLSIPNVRIRCRFRGNLPKRFETRMRWGAAREE